MAISAFAGEHIFTNPALHLFQEPALCIFLIGHISPLSVSAGNALLMHFPAVYIIYHIIKSQIHPAF